MARSIAENILQCLLNTDFKIGDHIVHLSASLGVAAYPEQGQDPDSLIRAADSALYNAKQAGRSRVYPKGPPLGQTCDL